MKPASVPRALLFVAALAVVCGGCTRGGSNPGNKGCITQGVACSPTSQCCSGLVCAAAGTCQPDPGSGCVAQGVACSATSQCCTGLVCALNGTCQPNTASGCGPSSVPCAGQCVVTLTDPKNCGGCGITCASSEVCTRGACGPLIGSCLADTVACEGSCIDPRTSNLHCGGCPGTACPSGQGCSAGTCVTLVLTDGGTPPPCTAGGPPINVTSDAGTFCTGNLAQISFRWSLCACSDVHITSGPFHTDAFDSSRAQDGGLGASVGANSRLFADSVFDIGGHAWSGGDPGFSNTNPNGRVRQDLWSNGPATGSGALTVDHDAHVNGDVTTTMTIGGKLYVPPGARTPNVTTTGGIVTGPVLVAQPCDCSPSQLIDVAGIINDGKLHNDNALIGLDPHVFENPPGSRRLDLPCGRYYLTRITPGYSSTIAVHGRAALFVDGDLSTVRATVGITIDPQAELDLFIGGTILNSTELRLGNIEVPAQFRVYIAGSPVDMSAVSVTAGNFYLPYSAFSSPSNLNLYGSIFAKSFAGQGDIHYDRGVLNAGAACGAPAPDAGTPACTSCRDCGNQACVAGRCGACTTAADCCAPLQCIGGHCAAGLN